MFFNDMVKKTWTSERSELSFGNIKSMAILKFNLNMSCLEFYQSIKNDIVTLKEIKGSEKYKKKTNIVSYLPLRTIDEVDVDEECNVTINENE